MWSCVWLYSLIEEDKFMIIFDYECSLVFERSWIEDIYSNKEIY